MVYAHLLLPYFSNMADLNTFLIPIPELFSFGECLWYLDRHLDDCTHAIEGDSVVKALAVNNDLLLFRIARLGNDLSVTFLEGTPTADNKQLVEAYIRKWFDMDADISSFYELLRKDERLAFMAEAFKGLHVVGINELFEALAWSIIGQQINLAFAFKMKRRITEKFGKTITCKGKDYFIFPDAAALSVVKPEELRPMQFSQKKAEYLIGLAKAFVNGELSETYIESLPDFESQQKELLKLRGIGVWTANYALMKSLHVPEAIPYGDAGILNAMIELGIIEQKHENAKIEVFFDRFKGWQNYMVYYLWRSRVVKK